jgi:hypothetical protein
VVWSGSTVLMALELTHFEDGKERIELLDLRATDMGLENGTHIL